MSQFTKEYRLFFDSPAGVAFRQFLDTAIDSSHTTAENDPDKARDYMQQAKGIRHVIDHINSVTAERKTQAEKLYSLS